MVAGQAANMAVHTALEKKGRADDITVLVIDFCSSPNEVGGCEMGYEGGGWGVGGAAEVPPGDSTRACTGCTHVFMSRLQGKVRVPSAPPPLPLLR